MYLDESIAKIKSLDLFEDWEFRGCSNQEIQILEQALPRDYKLPDAYIEFLRFCGHGFGLFLGGEDFFYKHVLRMQNNNELERLMESNRYQGRLKNTFTEDMFMIFQHHGGEFARFIKLTEGNDPVVYYFKDAVDFHGYHIQEKSFSEYFMFEINKYIRIHSSFVYENPQIIQDKIVNYKLKLYELKNTFLLISKKSDGYINNYLFKRYSEALNNIYNLFLPYKSFYKSDFLISAKTKFLEENDELPEKDEIVTKMDEAVELIREIYDLQNI